ncbi:hypothetical protein PspLS_10832 [Pyricularia sp. CBS 133598]|nr:hypothetical protein PspLS_10832 [Pyricularia sp. CBS 133598]
MAPSADRRIRKDHSGATFENLRRPVPRQAAAPILHQLEDPTRIADIGALRLERAALDSFAGLMPAVLARL